MGSLILALIFAGLRIGGVGHPAFQAFAHLFVGWILRDGWMGWSKATLRHPSTILAIVLSVIEIVVAVVTRL